MPTILTILMADSLVQWIDQVISSFGYGGVVTLMLLENLFPPIPSEAILPLVAFSSTWKRSSLLFVL